MTIHSTPLLDELLAGQVISRSHYDAALARMTNYVAEPYSNLGEALLWLAEAHILVKEELEEIIALADSQSAFATNATRRQAVEQMHAAMEREVDALLQQQREQAQQAPLRVPGWLSWCGIALLVGAGAWYLFAPDSPPSCASSDTQKTLRLALSEAQRQHQSIAAMVNPGSQPNVLLAKLEDIKEIGYIKAQRSRGCTATLVIDKDKAPIAYTIGPNKDGDMVVSGADARIVRALYGPAAQGKDAADLAQPVGAERIRQLFEQRLADVDAEVRARGGARPKTDGLQGEAQTPPVAGVRNLVPVAKCQDKGGGTWSCRLMGEASDRLMSAIGAGDWTVFEGDFDFVRAGDTWKLSDAFDHQYMQAMVRGRVGDIFGSAASNEMEQMEKAGDARSASQP